MGKVYHYEDFFQLSFGKEKPPNIVGAEVHYLPFKPAAVLHNPHRQIEGPSRQSTLMNGVSHIDFSGGRQ